MKKNRCKNNFGDFIEPLLNKLKFKISIYGFLKRGEHILLAKNKSIDKS